MKEKKMIKIIVCTVYYPPGMLREVEMRKMVSGFWRLVRLLSILGSESPLCGLFFVEHPTQLLLLCFVLSMGFGI